MASTTLVTFLYQAPRYASQIDLFGSWDNFSKPYPMKKDKSMSSRSWKGCHTFTNIVCDGDIVAMTGVTRDGALRMGGTYWYYYRIDDDIECHDPMVPSTRGCPFLPGQQVNVLEVPIQDDDGTTKELFNVFTLDPAARFASCSRQPKTTTPPVSPLKSALQRATSMKQSILSTMPKFSLARTRSTPNRRCRTGILERRVERVERPFSEAAASGLMEEWISFADSLDRIESKAPEEVAISCEAQPQPTQDFDFGFEQLNLDDAASVYSHQTPSAALSDDGLGESHVVDSPAPLPEYDTSRSDRTSGVFSLLPDSNIGSPFATNRHSLFYNQPQTPSFELDSFVLEPLSFELPSLDSMPPRVQEPYNQPQEEHSSSLTLRPLVTPLKDLNHTAQLSPFEKLDIVDSWRHGESPSSVPAAEPSALQELINDLGYLSSMIQ